jgi:hypothetical protein
MSNFDETKMEVLQDEMTDFVDTVHDDDRCLGSVPTFDTEVTLDEMHESGWSVKNQIRTLEPSGRTALYDSIIEVMNKWQHDRVGADRVKVPSLLVTVTDGQDNESKNSIDDVRKAIKGIGFHPENNCYFVLVGVGSNASEDELRRICEGGLGMYRHVNHVDEVLRLVLAATLVGVARQERYREIEETADELSVRELRRELTAVGIQDLDYMLNIDSSGSMGNSA